MFGRGSLFILKIDQGTMMVPHETALSMKIMARNPPHERLVYLALKTILKGADAQQNWKIVADVFKLDGNFVTRVDIGPFSQSVSKAIT
jgi:hypothetical protein